MGFFTVNKRLLPIKVHYFFYNAGITSVQPTMPVYAKVFKFSSFIVGIIYTILPIANLILKPVCGGIADKFQFHRGMNLLWVLLTLISFFVVQFIPPAAFHTADGTAKNYLAFNLSICSADSEHTYFKAEAENGTWKCPNTEKIWNLTTTKEYPLQHMGCISLPLKEPINVSHALCNFSHAQPREGEEEFFDDDATFSQWQFWVFLILLVLSGGAVAVVNTLSDTMCIEICEDSSLFGKQRVWGSLGWGIFAVINGLLIDAFSTEGEEKNYTPAFYLMLGPILIDILIFFYLKMVGSLLGLYRPIYGAGARGLLVPLMMVPVTRAETYGSNHLPWHNNPDNMNILVSAIKVNIKPESKSIVKDAWKVLMNPRAYLFMFWCTMMGASLGLLWNFLYWFLEELATAQGGDVNSRIKTIEGLVAGIQTFLGEAPAFFFGSKMIDTIGYGHTVSVILAVVGLRFTIYSFITNPWWILPVEILQSDYGLFYSTMTSYGKKIAIPGTEATIQSVFGALMEGVGKEKLRPYNLIPVFYTGQHKICSRLSDTNLVQTNPKTSF